MIDKEKEKINQKKAKDLRKAHPKPFAQAIFVFLNVLIFIFGVVFVFAFFLASSSKAAAFLLVAFGIIAFFLMFLSVLGCFGSRYGPKGKEFHLILLVIYFFSIFALVTVLIIFMLFLVYSSNQLMAAVEKYGKNIVDEFSAFLENFGAYKVSVMSLFSNSTFIILITVAVSLILFLGLIVCSYIMGFDNFLKSNLTYGSFFVILAGIAVLVVISIFWNIFKLSGSLKYIGLILVFVGVIIIILGGSGFGCGLCPQTCYVGLHLYAAILLVIGGVVIVLALIVMLFPSFFWQDLVDMVQEQCLDATPGVDDSELTKLCTSQMEAYFSAYCAPLNFTTYENKGRCSNVDVIDDISNSILNDLYNTIKMVAFSGIIVCVMLTYLVFMILVSLNYKFGSAGVKEVELNK